jgi:hypothetical protein
MPSFEIVDTADRYDRADRIVGFRLNRGGRYALDGHVLYAAVDWRNGADVCQSWIRLTR